MAYGTTTTIWEPRAAVDYADLQGKDVYSADGDKVGSIKRVLVPAGDFAAARGRYYFLLDPGVLREWFGGYADLYLPESAIASVGDDRVTVAYTKDRIKGLGWTAQPADFATYR
jgi:hypothetical protein